MKRFLLILSIIFVVFLAGCASTQDVKKETYNCAYVSIYFYNQSNSDNENNLKAIINNDSTSYSNNFNTYCQINDWEYGENNTIILYLKDGRTLQTSANNVLLMYQPEL